MHTTSKISVVKPFLSATVAIAVTGVLIALDRSLIAVDSYVVVGLWVILLTAILTMTVQIVHTEKVFAKQFAQLAAQKERLANEIKYRLWAEKTSSENKAKLQIIDENFPVMLAYFSTEQQCQYHNRAFRQWFGLRPEQVENRFLKEFFNQPLFSDISADIAHVLSGRTIQKQHVQLLANQSTCLVTGHFTPHFDSTGKVIGFYMLHTPRLIKEGEVLPQSMENQVVVAKQRQSQENKDVQVSNKNTDQHTVRVSIDSSKRIIQAIEQNEFRLYCQNIVATRSNQEMPTYYEVLIRMAEEESSLIPPGTFLPFVEKYNLMSRLDGWVAEKIIHHVAKQGVEPQISFCINLARSTLNDSSFADNIQKLLNATRIEPKKLCFEIEVADVVDNLQNTAQFVKKLQQPGCLVSLCSFNHDRNSFDLLKHIRADFLKIEGSLICNILRDTEDLRKVENISKFARALKIRTIGELVETQDIRERLAKIGIDYIQGFLVGRPLPIEKIEYRNGSTNDF